MRAKSAGQSPLLMLDVIDILNQLGLPYAVIGAMAVSYYGVPRSSLDADALLFSNMDEGILKKLRLNLEKNKFSVVTRHGDAEDPLRGMIIIEDKFGNHVDLILGIKKMDSGTSERIKKAEFEGATINMIGIKDLIAMKIFAGSRKDLEDVEGILAVSAEIIDKKKLRSITKGYGKTAFETLEKLLN